jgi:response regulator RpfG family c-di-GMP phosphodiesterase
MAQSGPIIVIDDDPDDQEILQEVIADLRITNKLIFFKKSSDAFHYLKTTTDKPLVIFSDINLPEQSGVDFKRHIDEDHQLREKSIPFVFFSTHVDKKIVDIAYKELTIQGFFQKSGNYEELKNIVRLVIDYWKVCKHPNSA